MGKVIKSVSLDAALVGYLLKKLEEAPPEASGAEELKTALVSLTDGTSDFVIVDSNADQETGVYDDRMIFGDLSISARSRKVMMREREIMLTPKEFDILLFLAGSPGTVFSKEEIYRAVWGDDQLLDDSNIMAFIRKLRKKIEPDPDSPVYILTVWGIGYKFSDSV